MKCKLKYNGVDQTYTCSVCGERYHESWVLLHPNHMCGSEDADPKTSHLMVDLETLGSGPRSVITQIGACWFNMDGTTGAEFKANINIQSALDAGLQIDGNTIKWWFGQDKEAQTFVNNTDKIEKVLAQFATFCQGAKNVWSHATFDMPILFNAYRELGIKIPFHYRAPRDIRTLVWMWGGNAKQLMEEIENDNHHDALSDCLYQVKYCTHIFKDIQDERNKGH